MKKPTLKPKLLSRPPFKYLYDIVMSCMQYCDFARAELPNEYIESSDNIKDKNDKIQFLAIVIQSIQNITNESVQCQPVKIIAGLESELTNIMLQQLYGACVQLQRNQQINNLTTTTLEHTNQPAAVQSAPTDAMSIPSEPQPTAVGSSGTTYNYIELSQQLLQPLIDKPRLTDKLLSKPPFRFIHDIITSLYNSHQWPSELYDSNELNSANYTDPQAKLVFLQKLIDHTSQCTHIDLSAVHAKKIAAGLEPENTNLLLQCVARAVSNHTISTPSPMSSQPIHNTITQSQPSPPPAQLHNVQNSDGIQSINTTKLTLAAVQISAAAVTRSPVRAAQLSITSSTQATNDNISSININPTEPIPSINSKSSNDPSDQFTPTVYERPKTARPAPPKVKPTLIENRQSNHIDANNVAAVVLDIGGDDEVDELSDVDSSGSDMVGYAGRQHADVFSMNADDDDGLLVKQIKQANNENFDPNAVTTVDNHTTSKQSTTYDIDKLRADIQRICGSVNPIGKIMSSVVDDVKQMHDELSKHQQRIASCNNQLNTQRQSTQAVLQPLITQLQHAQHNVADKQKQIDLVKSQIFRREIELHALFQQKTLIS